MDGPTSDQSSQREQTDRIAAAKGPVPGQPVTAPVICTCPGCAGHPAH